MQYLKFIFSFFVVIFFINDALAQTDSTIKTQPGVLRTEIVDGDTILVYDFDDFILKQVKDPEAEKKYLRLVRDVKKALPYAKIGAFRLQLMEENLATIKNKRERKKYMKASEKAIKEEFIDDLKNMSVSQGRILIKLIYRETGKTSYEILSDYTNSLTTVFWSSAAKVYGGNLRNTYDPAEDAQIEYIIKNLKLE